MENHILLQPKAMLELFIEMTNQVFWDGYAQQLSADNPELFRFRFKQFTDSYDAPQTRGSSTQGYFTQIIQNNYKRNSKRGMAA